MSNKKTYKEQEIKMALLHRLKREIEHAKTEPLVLPYFYGYREAINDIFWDLFSEVPSK